MSTKPQGRSFNVVCSLFCVIIVFIFLSSCSTAGKVSWLKFWDRQQASPELKHNDVVKFASSIRSPRGNPDSHYFLANYYQKKGLHKDAIEEYKKVITIDPLNIKAYNRLGVSFYQLGYYLEAIKSYQKALSIDPNIDYVLNNLGYSYLKQGNYVAAVQVLEQAAGLNSYDERIRGNLELAYTLNSQHERSLEETRTAGDGTGKDYILGNIRSGPRADIRENDISVYDLKEEQLKMFLSQLTSQGMDKNDIQGEPASDGIEQDKKIGNKNAGLDNRLQKVGIEISNGNGVNRMAARIGSYLRERGYHVVRLTNAASFNNPETLISYQRDYVNEAHGVEQQIPGNQIIQTAEMNDRPHVKIKVLIGNDIVKYNSVFTES